MVIIGDVHGHFGTYELLCQRFDGEPTVQIGDMGVGFPRSKDPIITGENFFFRGNHDNPKVANSYANCLGDFGVREIGGVKFFFVAGAWSIDHRFRKENSTWWRDEELSTAQLNDALDLYVETKPDLVLTHDAPEDASSRILQRYSITGTGMLYPTRTGQALQAMFENHQPKQWIFGHYHFDWKKEINGTEFQCLNELSWMRV